MLLKPDRQQDQARTAADGRDEQAAHITHTGSIRSLYGDAPTYADNFTVLGRITSGLEVVEQVAAGGQKDGEYAGPLLPLTIEAVELRD